MVVDSIVINLLKSLEDNRDSQHYSAAEDILIKVIFSKNNEGKFFKAMDLHLLLAASMASRGSYEKAIDEFDKAI